MSVIMCAHVLLKTCKLMKICAYVPTLTHKITVIIAHTKHASIEVVSLQVVAFDESQHRRPMPIATATGKLKGNKRP